LNKGGQLFTGMHNKALSVVAMCVCNPDRSPVLRKIRARRYAENAEDLRTTDYSDVTDWGAQAASLVVSAAQAQNAP